MKIFAAIFWIIIGAICLAPTILLTLAHHSPITLILLAAIIWTIYKYQADKKARIAAAQQNLLRAEEEVARTQEDLRKAQYQADLDRAAREAGIHLNPPQL
jgi:hypothetical protein